MARLKWDNIDERIYETGCDHGILFPQSYTGTTFETGSGGYGKGVAWNGLTNVTKSPGGAEETPVYADNIKFLSLRSAETFGGTIECLMYPDEWRQCNGETEVAEGVVIGQQRRRAFGFCYRSKIGNATEGEDYGFKLNLIYGATASPSEISNPTINESPEAGTLSYAFTTTPINVSGKGPDGKPYKPTSIITIDSTKTDKTKLEALEKILYGSDPTTESSTDGTDPRLPLPDEVISMFAVG